MFHENGVNQEQRGDVLQTKCIFHVLFYSASITVLLSTGR
jgi:hypothetical protein